MAKFRANPNFHDELRRDPRHKPALGEQADDARAAARLIGHSIRDTGYYARHFVIVDEHDEVRLGNTDAFAHLIEWGSANNPPFAPLRRGVRAAGFRLEEHPK